MLSPSEAKAALAGLLSAILPGAGQLLVGARRRGAVLLGCSMALGGAGVLVGRPGGDLFRVVVAPGFFEVLLAGNGLLLVLRAGAAWDALRAGTHPARRRRAEHRVVLAAVLVFTAVPHVAVVSYGYALDRALGAVFASAPPAVLPPSGVGPTVRAHRTPSVTIPPPGPTVPSVTDPSAAGAPRLTPPPPPWEGVDRLNVLLVGTDAGPGRRGARTDAMVLVSIEPASGGVALFGISRNLAGVPLSDPMARAFRCRCWPGLLNALYRYAEERPGFVPDSERPGIDALRGAVSELLGVPVHHHVVVDMAGFVAVVDALGGVEVVVPERIRVELSPPRPGEGWRTYDLRPGPQLLDGHQALAYVRSREGGSDYDRMRRQRCLLGALAADVDLTELMRELPRLARVVAESVVTDIPREALPDLVRIGVRVEPDRVLMVGLVPPDYALGRDRYGRPIPDVPRIREVVRTALDGDSAGTHLVRGEACTS